MKINEVLKESQVDEGLLDFGKKVVAGAKGLAQGGMKAGWQAQDAANKQAKNLQKIVTNALKKWAAQSQTIQASTGAPATPQDVVNWFTSFAGVAPVDKNPKTAPALLNQWLSKEISTYMLNKTPQTATATTQQTKPTATISALGKRGSTTAQTTTQTTYQSPLGITVRQSTDPVILDYKGKPFMLNNRGEWAMDGKDTAGAQASAPLQAEMDKVAGAGFTK
jgi:hypothetical protein